MSRCSRTGCASASPQCMPMRTPDGVLAASADEGPPRGVSLPRAAALLPGACPGCRNA